MQYTPKRDLDRDFRYRDSAASTDLNYLRNKFKRLQREAAKYQGATSDVRSDNVTHIGVRRTK